MIPNLDTLRPGPGQALLALEAVAVDPTDQLLGTLPSVFHGFSARVLELGPGPTQLYPGQEVWGFGARLPLARRILLATDFIAPRPLTLDALQAAALAAPALAAYECFRRVSPAAEEPVLVTGAADPVGALLLQLFQPHRQQPVLVTSGSLRTHQQLLELGHDESDILDYRGQTLDSLEEELRRRCGGFGVGVAFDLVGHRLRQLCCRALRVGGALVSLQQEPNDQPDWRDTPLNGRSCSLHSVFVPAYALSPDPGSARFYAQALTQLTALFESGQLQPTRIADVGTVSESTLAQCADLWGRRDRLGPLVARVESQLELELGIR